MGTAAAYLTAKEVLVRWEHPVTVGTMNNWRSLKKGPPFVKFGTRVRYPIAQLEVWEAANGHLFAANDNDKQ